MLPETTNKKSIDINNITDLRNNVLQSIKDLSEGKIEINQAIAISKMSDTVINTCKAQLEYSRMVGEDPHVPFLSGNAINKKALGFIEGESYTHGLPDPKSKFK